MQSHPLKVADLEKQLLSQKFEIKNLQKAAPGLLTQQHATQGISQSVCESIANAAVENRRSVTGQQSDRLSHASKARWLTRNSRTMPNSLRSS